MSSFSTSTAPICFKNCIIFKNSFLYNIGLFHLSVIEFGKKYPENIILIRYEDLCLDPYGTVEKLRIFLDYGYLKDPINNAIKSFTGLAKLDGQREISEEKHNDPMGFKKNSYRKPFDWREKISKPLLKNVEENCEKPMKTLGYAKYDPDKEQKLIKSAVEVWPFYK